MADTLDTDINKAKIVNWALVELGLAPSFTIDGADRLAGIVDIFWPRAVGRAFGLFDWTFCRRTDRLERQLATPQTGYAYGFDLPGGIIGVPVKFLRDPTDETPVRDTRIEGRTVFSHEQALWSVSKVPVDPASWDLQFADCFAILLASFLAVPLTQDAELADAKEAKAIGTRSEGGAGGVFGRLIAQHRAAHPVGSPFLRSDPLTMGRTTGW